MIQNISALDGVRKVKEMKNFGISYDYPKKDEYGINDTIYPLTEDETKQISKYLESSSKMAEKEVTILGFLNEKYVLEHDLPDAIRLPGEETPHPFICPVPGHLLLCITET